MKKIIAVLIIMLMSCSAGFAFMNDIKARRGCCSHHGGVCGCSNSGRAVCCDGSLSPSCGCN